MTDDAGSTPAERRTRIAKAIVSHRNAGHESPVRFTAGDGDVDTVDAPADADRPVVEYEDRLVTVTVDDAERERLDALLGEFPVFKVAQPETRKAAAGVVHVSAIADPKHAADFLDLLFLDVFEHPADYPLVVEAN
jgi:hypothetical protein